MTGVLDFCYPSSCPSCGKASASGGVFCGGCEEELSDVESDAACGKCAMPLAEPGSPCPHCSGKGLTPFDRICRLGAFREPLKELIHTMKYRKRWGVAEVLADRLLEHEPVKALLTESQVIVPVPLHPIRQIERSFNQAEVIARRLARRAGLRCVRAAARVRNTETQTHLHARARRAENLRDAFALVRPKALRDKHVVLVDDVMTTGSTLQSLARAIKHAEPASISAIVLAVADPLRHDFESI